MGKKERVRIQNGGTLEKSDAQSCLGGIRYNRAQWNQAEVSRGNRETERERERIRVTSG